MSNTTGLNTTFNDIYRGIVVDNTGVRGRCKIYVPGVYPTQFENDPASLPWAQPAMSLFGGNAPATVYDLFMDVNSSTNSPLSYKETGVCGWPHKNAHVWLFFEQGNHNFPVYFASVQAGEGWFSEHNMQWVYKSDNLRVRIDENPELDSSTSKNDSYNKNCTYLSKELTQTAMPTRLDIEIFGNVNLHIRGNANIKIEGDVFEEIIGDKHETLIGNLYRKHVGDIHYVHEGATKNEIKGDYDQSITGTAYMSNIGDQNNIVSQNRFTLIGSNDTLKVKDQRNEVYNDRNTTIMENDEIQINNSRSTTINGIDTEVAKNGKTVSSNKDISITSKTKLFLAGLRAMIFRAPKRYPRKG